MPNPDRAKLFRDLGWWADHIRIFRTEQWTASRRISRRHFLIRRRTASSDGVSEDPSFKIERLTVAKTPPVTVKPNDSLQKAMTILLSRNFSQLPVTTSEYILKGAVSWSSIGERTAIKCPGDTVQDCMTECQEVSIKTSVFKAIQLIKEHEFVVVRDTQNKISGIITANDIAAHFEETSTPFCYCQK